MGPRKVRELNKKQRSMKETIAQSYTTGRVSHKPRVSQYGIAGSFISSNPSVINGYPLRDVNSPALLVLCTPEKKALEPLTKNQGMLVVSSGTPKIFFTKMVSNKGTQRYMTGALTLPDRSCKDLNMVSGNSKSSVKSPLICTLYNHHLRTQRQRRARGRQASTSWCTRHGTRADFANTTRH